jgi:predicted MFS family arabinose efflux permease
VLASLTAAHGWRTAALTVACTALAVVPLVVWLLRDHPADVGLPAYGATEIEPKIVNHGAASRAVGALRRASGSGAFWALVVGFAICGASTNGLIGTHFIPAAHDHGMPETTAAGLLALIGIFDIAGTVFSGWLTDRIDPRMLLAAYYALRGASLLLLSNLLGAQAHPGMLFFIVFYGLDWVATVPPTIALCRTYFGADGPIVFGWVFASHQVGAAIAATGAGVIRDALGDYTLAWYAAGGLCFIAAAVSARIGVGRLATAPA